MSPKRRHENARQFADCGWLSSRAGGVASVPGQVDGWTYSLASARRRGVTGLIWPMAVRRLQRLDGAAFPIGWTISKIAPGAMFYLSLASWALCSN